MVDSKCKIPFKAESFNKINYLLINVSFDVKES